MDKSFQYLQEDIAESRLQRKKNLVTLNEAARRAELDTQEARLKSREEQKNTGKTVREDGIGKEPVPGKGNANRDDGLQANERNLANSLAAEKARKDAKDILLGEAVRILGDEVGIRNADARVVTRLQPRSVLVPARD